MKKLNPDQLYVEFRNGVTMTEPIIDRKYTLTHSDITAELFLTIGLQYAFEKINAMRDEVLAEWIIANGCPLLYVYVYVDGEFGPAVTAVRDAIFRRELPLALEAIRYGDRKFFAAHPALDSAPIWIHFDSTNSLYNKFEHWGTPGDYI
ncbi:staygreen family protein [Jeotgalibacillus malaysiensis]|uniref:staygreen family protein n=1 Tax=Jeotgalibacillus malaysiensis TaxID=1508404 RepID=UPI00384C4D29